MNNKQTEKDFANPTQRRKRKICLSRITNRMEKKNVIVIVESVYTTNSSMAPLII